MEDSAGELFPAEAMNSANMSDFSTFNSTLGTTVAKDRSVVEVSVGILMAVIGNVLIGFSLVVRRRGLQNVARGGDVRASEGGFGHWKSGMWWLGTISLGVAQVFMLGALILAPAILVAPVGVVRVLTVSTTAPCLLKERMRTLGWLGCLLVICGCIIFIVSGPKDKDISNIEEFNAMFLSPSFLAFIAIAAVIIIVLFALAPKYGSRFLLLYVLMEGFAGAVNIWLAKGIGVAVATKSFAEWTVWVSVVLVIAGMAIQFFANNRSADLFDAALVMSSSYVVLCTGVILTALVLFPFEFFNIKDSVLMVFGFLVNVIGLIVMIKGKNIEFNLFETIESHDEKNDNDCKIRENSGPAQSNEISYQSSAALQIPNLASEELQNHQNGSWVANRDECQAGRDFGGVGASTKDDGLSRGYLASEFENRLDIAHSAAALNKSFEVSPSDIQGRLV